MTTQRFILGLMLAAGPIIIIGLLILFLWAYNKYQDWQLARQGWHRIGTIIPGGIMHEEGHTL